MEHNVNVLSMRLSARILVLVFSFFSFSSFGELEKDVDVLLKRIRKFSMAQVIGARTAVHIFSRINFAIASRVGAQIVSRLPTNFLIRSKKVQTSTWGPTERSPSSYLVPLGHKLEKLLGHVWYREFQ
ncbi:hypothetical protein Tco_1398961 [Tanacetum coccineum]